MYFLYKIIQELQSSQQIFLDILKMLFECLPVSLKKNVHFILFSNSLNLNHYKNKIHIKLLKKYIKNKLNVSQKDSSII